MKCSNHFECIVSTFDLPLIIRHSWVIIGIISTVIHGTGYIS